MRICSIDGCGKIHEARGYCRQHYQQWSWHGEPLKRVRVERGSGWKSNHGYRLISDKLEHVLIAERAIGKQLPKGAVVHHVDKNPVNNEPTNLVVCPSQAYHLLIHQRQAAYDACGNASYRKCVYCGEYSDPAGMKVHQKKSTTTTYRHSTCRGARRGTNKHQ